MNIKDIINKKRLKKELSYDELSYAFNGYLKKEIPDYQMSALLMAITINGFNYNETENLTDIFIKSGETYHFNKKICDKHSTGGIGDTVTFIVAPILAALNIPIAKMSGRSLGITGGTIDKLESIPGYNINLSKEDFMNYIDKVNIAIGSQTDNLVPLDKMVYSLRDVTATTESLGLIASSIMSKKIACGASFIIIDIKYGEGALIKTKEDAEILSNWFINIGKKYNVEVRTIKNTMDEPLSNSIGNAIEVLEAIEILKGKETKLTDISLELAANLISMYKNIPLNNALDEAKKTLKDNTAYLAFKSWIENQGGDISKIKVSDNILKIKSNKNGKIEKVSALACGNLALKLGAGRINKDTKIDYSVGIKILKNQGEYVKKDETLALLYVNDLNINLTEEDLKIFTIK